MAIYFYSKSERFFHLSNFSLHEMEIDGQVWPTVEHYFQAQKFSDEAYREKIRTASQPSQAKILGRSRNVPIRPDWDEYRDDVMYRVCLIKFQSYPELRDLLLSTGDEELLENAPRDYYWGCGAKKTGQNKLGQILMRIRGELRKE